MFTVRTFPASYPITWTFLRCLPLWLKIIIFVLIIWIEQNLWKYPYLVLYLSCNCKTVPKLFEEPFFRFWSGSGKLGLFLIDFSKMNCTRGKRLRLKKLLFFPLWDSPLFPLSADCQCQTRFASERRGFQGEINKDTWGGISHCKAWLWSPRSDACGRWCGNNLRFQHTHHYWVSITASHKRVYLCSL